MWLFFVILWAEQIYQAYRGLDLKYKKRWTYAIVVIVVLLSQFKPERLFKYPDRYYFQAMKEIMPTQYYAWDRQLKENIKYRNERGHLTNDSSYFSRFPHLNLTDSLEKYRTYYKEKIRN